MPQKSTVLSLKNKSICLLFFKCYAENHYFYLIHLTFMGAFMNMALLSSINYGALAAATVTFFILGALWFSPLLFGNLWASELRKLNIIIPHPTMTHLIKSMFLSFCTKTVAAFCMAILVIMTGTLGLWDGMLLGALVGIGFNSTSIASVCIWENRSLTLFLISSGYATTGMIILSVILSVWR